ncbi:tannase/feruloyl esterase family alpha/beta hydrolase [Sinosporangium siamense]|uniref:Feruloyl esterase n=1 Tax=Sinosporangium siamense TaxID=1367973 RepID=A0A919RMV2_9ACTN|nr:tannase/feruloyl esterase family alpha/beta hydrolase [Sinosporangium siamense]GII96697.1 feruloyl esterase [Sinosporangium siamense]
MNIIAHTSGGKPTGNHVAGRKKSHRWRRICAAVLVALLTTSLAGMPAAHATSAEDPQVAIMEQEAALGKHAYKNLFNGAKPDCAAMANKWIKDDAGDAMLLSTQVAPARNAEISAVDAGGAVTTDLKDKTVPTPRHCVVSGYVAPQVSFELRLPDAKAWNGRFMLVACAGFCGTVNSSACNPGLSRGYAVVTTNGGHTGSPGFQATWAHRDNAARHDFAYRANHVATLLSKKIVAAYYGKPAAYSYVVGCSKGGNSAVRYASRYPAEFDGILASAPVLDYQGRVSTSFSWQAQALEKNGKTVLSPADLKVLHESILDQCDGADARKDGILNDPAACKPDFAAMACDRSELSGPNCFSKAQIEALRKLYAPPADSKGRMVYPAGQTPGSELNAIPWLTARPEVPGTPLVEHGADQWLRYMAYARQSDGSKKSAQNFNFDKDPADMEAMAKVYNATTTDLGKFEKHGGKLLITHGTADEGISLAATVDYYKRLIKASGGLAATQAFARLFQVPGMAHCSGGVGYDRFDALSALETWVEQGTAPEKIIAKRSSPPAAGEEAIPLYPYPLVPKFSGTGDPADPDSYRAVTSTSWR